MAYDSNRRVALAAFAGAVLGKVADVALEPLKGPAKEFGKKYFAGVFGLNPSASVNEEALLHALGLTRDSQPPQIFAGSGNVIGASQGKGLSRYLREATSELATHISKALSLQTVVLTSNDQDAFAYRANRPAVFLGGPPSNEVTAALLGYTHTSVVEDGKLVRMPIPDPKRRKVRWTPIYGETAFGEYGGRIELAARLDSKGNPVERPLYKVIDQLTGDILTPRVVGGVLESEWLSITRLIEAGKPKLVIGGLHGHSLEGFFADLAISMRNVASLAGSAKAYQILVPVDLRITVDLSGTRTIASQLQWKGAQIQHLHADA